MRDRAVTDTYEPGSTLKLVTAAAAINEGVWKTTELIDTNPGFVVIPGRAPITEALRHNYGVVSFETALIKSSNVGAIKIAQRIGPELLSQYLWRMGFGQALGPDFIGQSRGRVPSSGRMSASTLASLSMGYEIGVTPLQMVTAASIVANGGQLIEPRVVNAWIRNGRRQDVEPRVLKRAISPETAATLTAILERVVEPGGTATLAALQRYRVAGKTGTAEKVVNGRYSSTDHVVSFVGFLPSHQPRLTILVAMDAPRKGRIFGGTVAAPIFRRVAEAAMVHLGVTPSINPLPPVVVPTDRRALDVPSPRSASIIPTLTRVDTRAIMPDVRGMSLRDALRVTQALGLSTVTTEGTGVVVEQSPAPGAFVEPHVAGALQLRRLPAAGRNDR
jgi:cell division protein FtsI (penicillin-binding protein 3)